MSIPVESIEERCLIVGDSDCSFLDVSEAICKSPVRNLLQSKIPLIYLRLQLDVPHGLDYKSGDLKIIIFDMLAEWRGKAGSNATIDKLIQVMNEELPDVANQLQNLKRKIQAQALSVEADSTTNTKMTSGCGTYTSSVPSTPEDFSRSSVFSFGNTPGRISPKYVAMRNLSVSDDAHVNIRKQSIAAVSPCKTFVNVPRSVNLFVGRSDELQELANKVNGYLNSDNENTFSVSKTRRQEFVLAIIGLEGVGKTELLLAYLKDLCYNEDKNVFDAVIWINARSNDSIREDLATMVLKRFGIYVDYEEKLPLDELYTLIDQHKCLLIFDDIPNYKTLNEYLPRLGVKKIRNNFVCIVTSKNNEWNENSTEIIHLSSMKSTDAIMYVKQGLKIRNAEYDTDITDLVNRLQNFPLAITQAISFIKKRQKLYKDFSPQKCLSDYNANCKQLLSHKSPSIEKTSLEVFTSTLDVIEEGKSGELAIELVQVMAYMCTGLFISHSIVQQYNTASKIDSALELLEDHFVVSFNSRNASNSAYIDVHNLVQDTARVLSEKKGNHKIALEESLKLLLKSMNHESVEHAVSVWNHAAEHTDLIKEFLTYPTQVVENLIEAMKLRNALSFGQSALDKVRSVDADGCEQVYLELAIAYVMLHQSKMNDSRDYLLRIREKVTDNPAKFKPTLLLKIDYYIAQTMHRSCQYIEALIKCNEVSEKWKEMNAGEVCLDSLKVKLRIGSIERRLKNYDTSMKIFQEISEKLVTFATCGTTALALRIQCYKAITVGNIGWPLKALSSLNTVYKEAKSLLHKDHGLLQHIKTKIGLFQYRAGNFEESVSTLGLVLEKYEAFYGVNHRKTLLVKTLILESIAYTRPDSEAIQNAEKIYDEHKSMYGEKCFFTVCCQVLVGKMYSQNENHAKALNLLEHALKQESYVSYASNYSVWEAKYYISMSNSALGKTSLALQLLKTIKDQIREEIHEAYFLTDKINTRITELEKI